MKPGGCPAAGALQQRFEDPDATFCKARIGILVAGPETGSCRRVRPPSVHTEGQKLALCPSQIILANRPPSAETW